MDNMHKDREYAVSEVVAAILLISLVIIGISIVAVLLTSGPPPQDIPKANLQIIRTATPEDTISFYHGGGDPFTYSVTNFTDGSGRVIDRDKIYIRLRNTTTGLLEPSIKWSDHPELLWNYSSVITITDQTQSERQKGYQIHHIGGTGEYLIKEFGDPTYADVTITPTVPPYGSCEIPDASFSCSPGGTHGNVFTCSATDPGPGVHTWLFTGKQINTATRTGNPVSYTFPIPADTNPAGYIVQHTVVNSSAYCVATSNSSIQYVTVDSCPTAPCSAGFSYTVNGNAVYFKPDNTGDIKNISWNFGDGTTASGLSNLTPNKTYSDSKLEHLVELFIVKERCGQDFTCSVTQKVTTEKVQCGCFYDNYNTTTRKPWVVEFIWNPSTTCSGLTDKDWKVIFDYGDGTTETFSKDEFGKIPKWDGSISHSYTECRDYSVKMDVIDLHGGIYYTCTRTVNLPCICDRPPSPAFTVMDITTSNLTTIITDLSTPSDIVQWVYDFGDGSPPQTFESKPGPFIHTYAGCGSYVIKLIVHDAMGCWAETTRTISCGGGNCDPDDIQADFSVTADSLNPELFHFIDLSYSTNNTLKRWEWDFGDGRTAVNTSPPGTFPIEYDRCGSFPVKLRVWDDIGCWDDVIKEVTCNCPQPVAQFTIASMSNPREFRFTDASTYDASVTITNREWDFGDGVTSIGSSVTHRYANSGTYTVRLKVITSCGSWDHTFQDITTGCPTPKAAFDYETTVNPQEFIFTDKSTHDPGVNVSWLWEFGDGTNSTERNPVHQYASCNQYTVRLTVSTDCGTSNSVIRNVVCGCPTPIASFDYESTSNPDEFIFTDKSVHDPGVNVSWLWEFGDGTNSTEQNPVHRYSSCNQYTVRLTVTTDCGTSDDVIQDIICGCPPPVPDFDYTCIGERIVNFTDLSRGMGNGIRAWYWEFGDIRPDNTSGLQNPTHEYDNAGTYPVNLTVFTTCNSSARWTRQVTVPCCQMPVPDFTYTCLEDGNTIQFNDTSKVLGDAITRWSWNFGDKTGTSTDKNPRYRYSNPGTYPVNLTITTACGAQNSWIHNVTVPCLCSPPVANFTKEIVSSKPFIMRFTDHSVPNSNNITSWNWSFGDGTTYTGQNPPEKTYNACGEYLVNLRVTNDCGQFDDMDQLVCCPVFANFTYQLDPPDGQAPVTVYFTDLTEGKPNAWEWNFGDGNTSYQQNPVHIYKEGGNFTVTLHATSPCGGNETHSKILSFGCPEVVADFSYTIISEDPFNVSFRDLSYGGEIVDWTWFFGDGTTSKEQHPYHLYGGRENYNVGLIVKNSCGKTAQIWRRIAFDCPNLTADFNLTPASGMSPLEVKFTDNSTPLDKIMSWLWFFGDGTSYYTTSPPSRNPPNHTYSKIGTYYVTLQVKNECGNPFSKVKTVNVTNPASIRGYLWNDRNMNKIRDSDEAGLANWVVTLQERISGVWADRDSVSTNATGYYAFTLNDVTYGAFRVKETLQPRWNATYSYPFGDESPESGTLLISSTRNYNDVNFGNVRTNTSTFEFPDYYYYWNQTTNKYDRFMMNVEPRYWDFNTSFNWERQKIFAPGPFVISYTAKGDSSFYVTIGFYARYLIWVNVYGDPPIQYTHWLKYWMYQGVRTNGFSFYVPDNSVVTKPDLYFDIDNVRWFELYIPFEGSTIPYSSNSYVEAHMTGTGGSTTGCSLIAPVTKSLVWNRTWGYFTGNWDNTPYEGQWITITARNDFGTSGSPRYITSSKNVFVDWQPVTPVITSPANNTEVQGTANIIATVGGHNRDTGNVRLLVDGRDVGQLTFDSLNNIFTNTLNVEPYAGRTIKVVARAYPLPGKGTFRDSTPVYLRVRSISPIQANFIADPWNGSAPLEVAFTDTSTGGPASWVWNFNDGFGSIIQNPIHIFQNPGNYLVSLQVSNIQGTTSTISKYVNATGQLSTVNLLTNRKGILNPGYASWIVRGSGSTITVNGTAYPLSDGDRVRLDVGIAQDTANIRIVGEINSFNVTGVTLSVNGNPVDTGTCTAIQIHDFENYHSNLKLTAYRQANAWINFVWNGAPVPVQNYQNLEVSELMPSSDKIMELSLKPGDIYFDGRASSYRLYS